MLRLRVSLGPVALLATALLLPAVGTLAQTTAKPAAATASKAKHKAKPKPAPEPEVVQPPAPPPTLEQQAPVPPQVTYRDGQLSINSTNATLAQVLRSVQTQTGASIEVPPGAAGERVVANLGPGKPQAVLSALLSGSKFNYVILGVSGKPGAVQKVILLTRSNAPSGGDTSTQAAMRAPQPAPEPAEDEYPQPEPEVENVPQPVPAGVDISPADANQQFGNRTPEQMLQELQRMQQQQQQMQQQLNPANQQQVAPTNQQQPFGQPFIAPSMPPTQVNPQGGLPDQ